MSDTREHSYYEIALTNRQVMSIFIVLLVCLLASFVSGVWIGRQGAGVRVQTADAQIIELGSEESGAPLGEMDFFSRPSQDPTAAASPDGGSAPPPADEALPSAPEPSAAGASGASTREEPVARQKAGRREEVPSPDRAGREPEPAADRP